MKSILLLSLSAAALVLSSCTTTSSCCKTKSDCCEKKADACCDSKKKSDCATCDSTAKKKQ